MDVQLVGGKYIVSFDNVTYTSCKDDWDCPRQLVCNRNATWSYYPEQCTCLLTLGMTGENCETLNASGAAMVAASTLGMLISFVCFFLTSKDIFLSMINPVLKKRIKWGSALFTTMVLTNLATLSMFLQTVYQIASHFQARIEPQLMQGIWTKQTTLFELNLASDTTSFFFGVTAALNVSLVWLEIVRRVEKGRMLVYVNVFMYRKVLLAYDIIFGGLLVALMATGFPSYIFLLAAPALVFISVTYLYAWWKFSKIFSNLKKATSNNEDTSTKKDLLDVLINVKETSLGMSLSLFLAIIVAILQLVFINSNRPDNSSGAIPGRVFWVFVALSMAFLTRYTGKQVHSSLNKDRTRPMSSTGGAGGGGGRVINAAHE